MSKKILRRVWLIGLVLLLTQTTAWAQEVLQGSVVDAATGEPLAGANVGVKNSLRGTTTDLDGNFSLRVDGLPVVLVASYIGYEREERTVSTNEQVAFRLTPAEIEVGDLVVVGSRFAPRTVISSPVPIDNIRATELLATGQPTFDKMLMYTVPAFNSSQQTISDATAHFDPADLRGLGPSRTLVLINGKRKNASSLVYINDTPGKGEVGVDMKSIPVDAIARIEILRDGASAQYGSDAIAGVVNVILKEEVGVTDVNVYSGITTEGDGLRYGYGINRGFALGQGGFINLSHSLSRQEETNRPGEPGEDNLFGVPANDPQWGSWLQDYPDLGMHVGLPNMTAGDVFANAVYPLQSMQAEVYAFGGVTYREGKSYALYRTPYWIPDEHFLVHDQGEPYVGFQPTFETEIFDHTATLGLRGMMQGWEFDLSASSGSNTVDYMVNNSINLALEEKSPTSFDVGGYGFNHMLADFDISRRFNILTVSAGTEIRQENFIANAGEPDSYEGAGVQSFPGLQPDNEVDETRTNIGVYGDVGVDLTEDFFVGGAARFENYSDFGDNFTWKVNGRYLLMEGNMTLRASASTGFRAPSLHQIFLSNIQTLVSGGTVSNQGTYNNEDPVLRELEVPLLKEENAFNVTAGVAFRSPSGLTLSADVYQIDVDDRIVYSSSVASQDEKTLVGRILKENNITSLKFFTNAVDTRSQGVDIVANYGMDLDSGRLSVNLAVNLNDTEIRGEITTPGPIAEADFDIFDRKEQSRILSARPKDKEILTLSYEMDNLRVAFNNTRFGEVTWQHGTDPSKDQTFSAKFITDLDLEYQVNDMIGVGVSANNLFNVYPDEIDTHGDVVTDLGGRFKYPWEVNQFGFAGTTVPGNVKIRF